MEDKFQPPPWVCMPKLENCGLKVRKDGKIISIVTDINKKNFLLWEEMQKCQIYV